MTLYCRDCGEELFRVIDAKGWHMKVKGRLVYECRTCERAVLIREQPEPARDNKSASAGEFE